MEMAGTTQIVFLHEDVTIPCKILGSPHLDLSIVGVIWSLKKDGDESEVHVFKFYGDHLEVVRPGASVSLLGLEHGDASLYLPRFEQWEAGEYQCKVVVTPEKKEGTTRLEVVGEFFMEVPCGSDAAGVVVGVWMDKRSRGSEHG